LGIGGVAQVNFVVVGAIIVALGVYEAREAASQPPTGD
jgi:hypothetical protein